MRIANLGQYVQYRHLNHTRAAPVVDVNDATTGFPTAQQRAMFLLSTNPHDGVKFRVDLQGAGASTTLDVLFYDERTDTWTVDTDQAIVMAAPGSREYDILTAGRPVYLRVAAIAGTNVVLDIKGATFQTSKV